MVYDDEGRVTQSTVSSVNGTVKNSYAYDSTDDGNDRTVSTFTSTRGVTSVYDSESRITTRTISTKSPYVQSYTYDGDGYVSQEISGTSVFAYTYDDDGKITEIKKDGVLRQSYVYDSEGQLIRENNLDSNSTILYNYDGYGNITSKVSYPYTTGTVGEATGTVSYIYGDSSWKDKLTAFNGETVSYDAIGNPTTYRGATATWFGRQMQSYSKGSNSVTYKYDENGLRTSKTVNGVQHDYYYVDSVLMYEKVGSDYELFYRYDNEGKLSMIVRYNFDEAKNYYYNVVTNTQGDVVRILSGSGTILVEYTYDAWGKIVSIKNGSGTAITSSSNIGVMNSVRYRGYVYDTETGLYYLQSRYYDPEVGRFINCDEVNYFGTNDTFAGWNGFAYCENEPINCADFFGNFGYEMHFTQTKVWAEQFLSKDLFSTKTIKNVAYYLAAWDISVDEEKSTSPTADPFNHWAQSWHFNINSNRRGATDSRLLRYREQKKEAERCMRESYRCYKKGYHGDAKRFFMYSVYHMGRGLHSRQDMVAHSGKYGNIRMNVGSNYFYFHLPYGIDNYKVGDKKYCGSLGATRDVIKAFEKIYVKYYGRKKVW